MRPFSIPSNVQGCLKIKNFSRNAQKSALLLELEAYGVKVSDEMRGNKAKMVDLRKALKEKLGADTEDFDFLLRGEGNIANEILKMK